MRMELHDKGLVLSAPEIPVKSGAACGRTESSAPYRMRWTYSVRISELPQASREKSRKTEAVFLVGSRGLRGEIEIPPGIVFFLQLFLSEKQKKKLDGSRKFLICVLSCCMYGWLFV